MAPIIFCCSASSTFSWISPPVGAGVSEDPRTESAGRLNDAINRMAMSRPGISGIVRIISSLLFAGSQFRVC